MTPEMTSHICGGQSGVGARDRDTCSLEMDKTQSLTLTLGKSLGIYQQEEMSIRRGRGSLGTSYVTLMSFSILRSSDLVRVADTGG